MASLRLGSDERDGWTVVSITGELDVTTRSELDMYLVALPSATTPPKIVVDLSRVDFMDTSALTTLMRHWKRVTANGGELRLAGANYRNARVLWITGIARKIGMFDDVTAAVADRATT